MLKLFVLVSLSAAQCDPRFILEAWPGAHVKCADGEIQVWDDPEGRPKPTPEQLETAAQDFEAREQSRVRKESLVQAAELRAKARQFGELAKDATLDAETKAAIEEKAAALEVEAVKAVEATEATTAP